MLSLKPLFCRTAAATTVLLLNIFSVHAQASWDEKVAATIQQVIDDKGQGWMCEWYATMPVGVSANPTVAPGERGFSDVEVYYRGGDLVLAISGFMGNYTLPIIIEAENGRIVTHLSPVFDSWTGYGDKSGKSGLVSKAPSRTVYNYDLYIPYTELLSASGNSNSVSFDLTYVESDSPGTTAVLRHDAGFLVLRDWDGLPQTASTIDRQDILYVSEIGFRFFRADEGLAIASLSTENCDGTVRESVTYPVFYSLEGTSVAVRNLYGAGAEYGGDAIDFGYGPFTFTPTPFVHTLKDNAALEAVTSGHLRLGSLLLWGTGKPMNNGTTQLWFVDLWESEAQTYTDYAIVDEDAFQSLDMQSLVAGGTELKTFHDAVHASALARPKATVSGVSVNPHWDSIADGGNGTEGGSDITITIAPHYLIPITYNYSYVPSDASYYNTFFTVEPDVVHVTGLEISIPAETTDAVARPAIGFELKDYGNGSMYDDTDAEYLYFTGVLSSEATDTELYIAPGRFDTTDEVCSDPDKGHKNGVCLRDYIYGGGNVEKTMAVGDMAAATEVQYLVPKTVFPVSAAEEPEEYTVYARYTAAQGSPRFRVLSTLTTENITTGRDAATTDLSDRSFYRLEGNTLTAVGADLTVYDTSGRTLLHLKAAETTTLTPGTYLVASTPADSSIASPAKIYVP